MPRVLGVDIGTVRLGLAISDPMGITAQPLDVVDVTTTTPGDVIVARIEDLGVEVIVVGMPIRMDGTRGDAADAAESLAAELERRTGLPVIRWDERLSSKQAERIMRSGGTSARKQRGKVDKVAAALVLQSYLESRN